LPKAARAVARRQASKANVIATFLRLRGGTCVLAFFSLRLSEGLQQSDPIELMKMWVRESVAAIVCRVEQKQSAIFDEFDLNER
jgi:hypothetical protein